MEPNPSNFDICINIEGRKIRKIFNAIPGRNPWMKDFTALLHGKASFSINTLAILLCHCILSHFAKAGIQKLYKSSCLK